MLHLNHFVEGSPTARRTAFVAHGILGSLRNWRTFARALAQRHPEWRFVLVDLRNHGDSHGFAGPHDVRASARDLAELASFLGERPDLVIGHSFGGKVALAYARDHGAGLRAVWALDSTPDAGRTPAADDSEVLRVFGTLRALPMPLPTRDAVITAIRAAGLSEGLAQWMTTNLTAAEGGGFRWRFDLDAAEAMLASYFAEDLLPFLRETTLPVHLVRAERSDRWTPELLAALEGCPPNVQLHLLRDAGHWVHVDNPAGLMDLLEISLGAHS